MSLYKKLFNVFEEHYLMYAMIGILVSSCLGAGATMITLRQGHGFWEMFQVGLLVAVCMTYLATILANLKAKTTFNLGLASVATSSVILLIHIL